MKHPFFLLLFVCLNSMAHSQNLFVADYGLNGPESRTIIGYDHSIFSAISIGGGVINYMKTDSAGNVLWSNDMTFPGTFIFDLTDVTQAADSGFTILQNWSTQTSVQTDPIVTRLDKNGNHVWTYRYISSSIARGSSIIKNNDNGFMVVGSWAAYNMVMKCDSSGALTWVKNYYMVPTWNFDIATHDYNRFVITGSGGPYIMFFQIDLSGNLYWNTAYRINTLPTSPYPQTWSFKPLRNGGYISSGCVFYSSSFSYDGFLLKTDSAGGINWMKAYQPGQGITTDAVELADSSIIMVGSGVPGPLLLKTDKNGTFQFAKTESVQGDYSNINLFSPGTMLLSGKLSLPFIALTDTACSSLCNVTPYTIQEFTPPFPDTIINLSPVSLSFYVDTPQVIYTVHSLTRNLLCGGASVNEYVSPYEINIYPNPVTDKLKIETDAPGNSAFIIYDITSRKVMHKEFTNVVTLKTEMFSGGMYFYEVRNKNIVIRKGKLVKE